MKKTQLALAVASALACIPSKAGTVTTPHGSVKVTMAGRIKCEAVRPDGTRRVLADWFDNLILDQGLNRIGTGSFLDACQVGTGSTAPANSDTALVARVAGTTTIQASATGTASSSPYYGYTQRTYRFAQGAAAGNLTEVGIGWSTTGATLFSRALIKDGGGSPTTITVLSDEFLDVSYELRSYAPVGDSSVDVVISGTTYTFTIRASNVTTATYWAPRNQAISYQNDGGGLGAQSAYNGTIAAVTATPNGSSASPTSVNKLTYSNNSNQADFTVFWDLNAGNLSGGITALLFDSTLGGFQMGVSPALAKTGTKLLSLTYRVSWARHA